MNTKPAGICAHPDCNRSVAAKSKLCLRHKAASEQAAEDLLVRERKFYGPFWPADQSEKGDA